METALAQKKFQHPEVTASGEARAVVELSGAQTLWFNTGTLCNIACQHCYIESSPTNDTLVYLSAEEVAGYLAQIRERAWPTSEIGFTGGEPFMNPDILAMAGLALEEGFRTLVLTNAMRPMMRPRIQKGLVELRERHGDQLLLRVSLDHYQPTLHDSERGKGSFDISMRGMRWLSENGFQMHVAGRTRWNESEEEMRDGFRRLFASEGFAIDADDPVACMLFPEMDEMADVPEITESCWGILGVSPREMMCSSARMVIKRKGAKRPAVLACTLITKDPQFEMGETLEEAERPVSLNHPHCATFCVLGGASCSR